MGPAPDGEGQQSRTGRAPEKVFAIGSRSRIARRTSLWHVSLWLDMCVTWTVLGRRYLRSPTRVTDVRQRPGVSVRRHPYAQGHVACCFCFARFFAPDPGYRRSVWFGSLIRFYHEHQRLCSLSVSWLPEHAQIVDDN